MLIKIISRGFSSSSRLAVERRPNYFITTPIFYVNSAPHIGHVHSLLLADALNIFNRLKLGTQNSILSTGTDEHGIKIQTAAQANQLDYKEFCDINTKKFSSLFDVYDTTITDFIRTTEERHRNCVTAMWNELDKRNYIYKNIYEGWYCVSDELFVPKSQISVKEIEGNQIHLDANGNELVWSSEENYMFKMSELEEKIMDWLKRDTPLKPSKFNQVAIDMMEKSPIGDISISRPRDRLEWGIQVPGDPSQIIYVWLDALANYLTVGGYPCPQDNLRRWPIDCQILGKDIIKFHAIYWPAFLMALSLSLPKKMICHSHWLLDSYKMSKSRGNVLNPHDENQVLTPEGVRYYLLRCSTPHSDTDYNRIQAVRRVNAELADTFGNLLNRCCSTAINPSQSFQTHLIETPDIKNFDPLKEQLIKANETCTVEFEEGNFYRGVDEVMTALRINNSIYQDMKPWRLIKEIDSNVRANESYSNLQAITYETLRICSLLLQPIVPKLTARALDRLGISQRLWRDAQFSLNCGESKPHDVKIQPFDSPLFQRIKTS